MFQGQLSFDEILIPAGSGRGRPRTIAGEQRRQKAAASAAKRAAKAALPPGAIEEQYRRDRKVWDAKRYKRCPEKVKAGARRSYRRHFAARSKTSAERYRNNIVVKMIISAARRARKRGLEFNLTAKDIVVPAFCPVLGIPIIIGTKPLRPGNVRCGTSDNSPSLDRFDNELGYVVGNVFVISYRANRLKGDANIDDMEKILKYMRQEPPA